MKKVFITGISGFAGSFLAEHFVSSGLVEVYGTTISDDSPNLSSIKEKLNLVKLDLMDSKKVSEVISDIMPDSVFHLAALTAPSESFANPAGFLTNNITAQVNVLEGIKLANLPNTKVLVVSSADIYGIVKPEDLPINEKAPLNPANPYAVSKIAQDFLGLQYANSYTMHIVRVRPFNHIGPRQTPQFVVSKFAKQIADIEHKKMEPILKVGNLDAKRDFTDVRDMVKAYDLVLEKGTAGDVYNIGSGVSFTIKEILEKLLSLSSVSIKIEQDKNLLRPSDNPELVCDCSKIKSLTGWNSEISIDQTLRDTLDYWRNIG
jgi:GDP-4-dehydro-6-deoxy-D-mannose reductase